MVAMSAVVRLLPRKVNVFRRRLSRIERTTSLIPPTTRPVAGASLTPGLLQALDTHAAVKTLTDAGADEALRLWRWSRSRARRQCRRKRRVRPLSAFRPTGLSLPSEDRQA